VWSLKPERWISLLVQENNQEEKACDKRRIIMVIIIIFGSTALGGPWPPEANVARDCYPGHPPAGFYNPVSLRLPLPRQSILNNN
jgi:hypothetical protein